jgi:hypothetical protein
VKDNFPKWCFGVVPKEDVLNLCWENKRLIKFMQKVLKVGKKKPSIISLVSWVPFVIILIFHPLTSK